jgi:hypothetical protein
MDCDSETELSALNISMTTRTVSDMVAPPAQ